MVVNFENNRRASTIQWGKLNNAVSSFNTAAVLILLIVTFVDDVVLTSVFEFTGVVYVE